MRQATRPWPKRSPETLVPEVEAVPLSVQSGVIGCAIQARIEEPSRSLEEILYHVTRQGLADAGLGIEDIDGIVVAANDQYDGRAIAVMAASGSVGGVGRDILSTPSASEHAFVMGALRVASGQYRTHLVVSWSPTESASLSEVQRLAADPYFHRALPLDELSAHALQATALENAVPNMRQLAVSVAAKNRRHGERAYPGAAPTAEPDAILASRPIRWPLRQAMVAPPATGAVAMVLASADYIEEKGLEDVAWMGGMGWATEPGFLGDRDLSAAPSLAAAAQGAYRDAGVGDPAAAIDLAEVADATSYQELLAYEGLGLCPRGQWHKRVDDGSFARGGRWPVNLSGGALTCNPVFCTGLIRIAEIANQVRGRAGHHQLAGAKCGVAHAASGFAMQYNTVVLMHRQPAGAAP